MGLAAIAFSMTGPAPWSRSVAENYLSRAEQKPNNFMYSAGASDRLSGPVIPPFRQLYN